MRFLVDAQLPPVLARWISDNGHEGEHVFDHGMGAASDLEIWLFAVQRGMVILSKDEDFARRKTLKSGGPAVVWLRRPNTRSQTLLFWFSRVFPEIVSALERGETLIEIV